MKTYITNSQNETKDLGGKLAKMVRLTHHKNSVIALTGELGAGKTTFVQGFAQGLGIKDKIISPTFVLIRQHQIPNSSYKLFHIDLYRLENLNDVKQLGLEEIWSNPNNIVLIEWAEKAEDLLPKENIKISFETNGKNSRKIKFWGLPF